MKVKRILCFSFILCMLLSVPSHVYAQEAYYTYNYSTNNVEVASPDIYEVDKVVYGSQMACGSFKEAQDIFIDGKDRVYILDSGNSRVILLDANYGYTGEISRFVYEDMELTLENGASGIFYQDTTDTLYIADTNNNRIISCDRQGKVKRIFEKPQTPLISEKIDYMPTKVIADNNNNLYVLSKNINTGAVMVDENNTFISFYGVNKVKETALIKAERLWAKILPGSQSIDYSFQPVEYNNLFWGTDRFIYAVASRNEYLQSELCKLNALGNNVMPTSAFADQGENSDKVVVCDVTVEENGFFTILDRYNCKLYNYDSSGNLIGAFGGIGEQAGLFKTPNAVEVNSRGELVVIDADKNDLTVFKPTYYAEIIRKALILFQDGQYVDSIEPWKEVLRINTNFNLAYIGMGKANMMLGNYAQAMQQFKIGGDKESYSDAKQSVRDEMLKAHFALVLFLVVLLIVVLVFMDKIIIFVKQNVKLPGRKKK